MPKTRKNKERNELRKMMDGAAEHRKERSGVEKEFSRMSRRKIMETYNEVKSLGKDIMNSHTYNVLIKYLTRKQRRALKVEWGILKAIKV